jgi:hypothetical protein
MTILCLAGIYYYRYCSTIHLYWSYTCHSLFFSFILYVGPMHMFGLICNNRVIFDMLLSDLLGAGGQLYSQLTLELRTVGMLMSY